MNLRSMWWCEQQTLRRRIVPDVLQCSSDGRSFQSNSKGIEVGGLEKFIFCVWMQLHFADDAQESPVELFHKLKLYSDADHSNQSTKRPVDSHPFRAARSVYIAFAVPYRSS